jgi:putative thiamine transport system permease protein
VTFTPKNQNKFLLLFPGIVFFTFLATVGAGLLGTWLPSLGYLPAMGKTSLTLHPWTELFNHPALGGAIRSTLVSGWGTALGAFLLSGLLFAMNYGSRTWRVMEKMLAPILSVPHAAFAIGLSFLISPAGWLVRMVSPELTGFDLPPDWVIPKDPHGLSLMLALVLKETPFLILVMAGALQQIDYSATMAVGQSLGYRPAQVRLKIILPQLFPHMRLSLYAVIAYSLSVVDMSMILGPTTPPTLPVLVVQWFNDPMLETRLMGAAGATLLLGMVLGSLFLAYLLEKTAIALFERRMANGERETLLSPMAPVGRTLLIGGMTVFTLAMVILVLWSFTWRWQFPDILPEQWSCRFWEKSLHALGSPMVTTLLLGLASTIAGLVLTIGCLEYESTLLEPHAVNRYKRYMSIIYLPLLLPQVAFIFGFQMMLTGFHLDASATGVVWSHLIFVLPYLFLTLGSTYRSFDRRITTTATLLCGSPMKAFLKVKLPMLLRPILFSFAVGVSVSVAQYIPTLFIGAGRFSTITTEVVTLAGGSDRRVAAVYALYQQLIPMGIYLLALFVPKLMFMNRKLMQR